MHGILCHYGKKPAFQNPSWPLKLTPPEQPLEAGPAPCPHPLSAAAPRSRGGPKMRPGGVASNLGSLSGGSEGVQPPRRAPRPGSGWSRENDPNKLADFCRSRVRVVPLTAQARSTVRTTQPPAHAALHGASGALGDGEKFAHPQLPCWGPGLLLSRTSWPRLSTRFCKAQGLWGVDNSGLGSEASARRIDKGHPTICKIPRF